MEVVLIRAIVWFAQILELLIMLRAIMSWFVRNPYSLAGRIYGMTISLTEPLAAPIRNLMNKFNGGSMVDWSLFIAFLLIGIVRNLLIRLIMIIL